MRPEKPKATTNSSDEEEFACYCGDWPFRNAHFIVDDIRKDVCRDLPPYLEIDGKTYCVLHYPDKEKASDFEPVFKERIETGNWDFRMVYFPKFMSYEERDFTIAADFSHASFAEGLSFKRCKFLADFDFWDARFLDDSFFTGSDFHKQINFNNSNFQMHGDFAAVTFHKESFATFNRTFFKRSSFGSCTFHCEARFSEATFQEHLDFSHAEFFSKADFKRISLPETNKAEFDDVKFYKSANFEHVDFGETDFTGTKFALSENSTFEHAIFKNCSFRKSVSFSGAEFHSTADFSKSTFADAHFEDATFSSMANFLESSFSGDVFFNNTRFGYKEKHRIKSAQATFDGASFGKDSRVFFDNTWFSWHTSFDYVKFDGYVFFKGTEENPVFDTVFERHAFWSLLKILNATFDRPDKVYFQAVRLRPSWLVNLISELRRFNFTNIDWTDERGHFITIKAELGVIEKLAKHHSKRLLAIVFRQLAENAELNSRFEEASRFRRLAMDTEWLEKKTRLARLITNLDVEADKLKIRYGQAILGKSASEANERKATSSFFRVVYRSDGFFVHFIYRITSYYGESWAWASFVLLLMILILFP